MDGQEATYVATGSAVGGGLLTLMVPKMWDSLCTAVGKVQNQQDSERNKLIDTLQNDVKELKAECAELRKQNKECDDNNEALKLKQAHFQKEVSDLQAEVRLYKTMVSNPPSPMVPLVAPLNDSTQLARDIAKAMLALKNEDIANAK